MNNDNKTMVSFSSKRPYLPNKIAFSLILLIIFLVGLTGIFATGKFDWKIQEFIADYSMKNKSENKVIPNLEHLFSDNYSLARKRFIDAGRSAGAVMSQIVINERGPFGELLSIDIAWLGTLSPKRVLLHTSGVHGVEGFAGSAIQLKLLKDPPQPPEGSAIIFVHILNPYGMAWLRRYNETNVDLNRNFRFRPNDWSEKSLAYAQLDSFLNPTKQRFLDSFLVQSLYNVFRFGMDELRETIPKGQNYNPKGLFYFGNQLEEGPNLFHRWIKEHLSSIKSLIVIDVHTGLGKLGQESLFHKTTITNSELLSKKLNRQLQTGHSSEGKLAYTFNGGHSEIYMRLNHGCRVDFITQEFGTYPNLYVLQALRDENRSHHLGGTPRNDRTKLRLKEAFSPRLPAWQSKVVGDGVSLFVRSAELLSYLENE